MMNHYFYNGRQVGHYYAGWGTRDNSCCESNYSNAEQAYFAQMMQSQYMPYSQLPMQIVHYDVHPAGLFSIPYGGTYFL